MDIDDRVQRARLRRQVQPERPRQRPGRRRQDLRPSRARPTACRCTYNRNLFSRPASTPTSRPRRGTRSAPPPRRSPTKTGSAGYAEMATEQHRRLAARPTATYARGGRMETVDDDGKVTATAQQRRDQGGPRVPQGHALGGQLAGLDVRLDWGTINQAFAAGQIGMYTAGSDVYTALVQNNGIKPDDYGLTDRSRSRATERRRPRRRHPRGGQRRHRRGRARRRGQVDRLLLHAEAAEPGGRRRRRQGARGQRPAGRRPRRCRSSTRRPTSSRRSGSRTTSTSRSTR